jgi:hypothetical protein
MGTIAKRGTEYDGKLRVLECWCRPNGMLEDAHVAPAVKIRQSPIIVTQKDAKKLAISFVANKWQFLSSLLPWPSRRRATERPQRAAR